MQIVTDVTVFFFTNSVPYLNLNIINFTFVKVLQIRLETSSNLYCIAFINAWSCYLYMCVCCMFFFLCFMYNWTRALFELMVLFTKSTLFSFICPTLFYLILPYTVCNMVSHWVVWNVSCFSGILPPDVPNGFIAKLKNREGHL